jgi:hypothetical protein
MQNNQNKLIFYKLSYLEFRYKKITDILFVLSNHINFLESIYYIDPAKKIELLSDLFNINKNINNIYNKYILSNIDINNDKIVSILNNTNDININLLYPIYNSYINDIPFIDEENLILKIISLIGYSDLTMLFKINKIDYTILPTNVINLINEINNIFIPTSFNLFKLELHENINFYWRVPKIYNTEDILQYTRELWIQNIDNTY